MSGLDNKSKSILCYVFGWISGLVFLVTEKNNWEVRFHAMQSFILFGFLTVIQVILGIFASVPLLGLPFKWLVLPIFGLVIFIAWLAMVVSTALGNTIRIPVLSDIIKDQMNK